VVTPFCLSFSSIFPFLFYPFFLFFHQFYQQFPLLFNHNHNRLIDVVFWHIDGWPFHQKGGGKCAKWMDEDGIIPSTPTFKQTPLLSALIGNAVIMMLMINDWGERDYYYCDKRGENK
jgi:hypothetical protein